MVPKASGWNLESVDPQCKRDMGVASGRGFATKSRLRRKKPARGQKPLRRRVSGSDDLRHFNWKVVWKLNWVKVLYLTTQVPRYSAIVTTVLLTLYWQQVSLQFEVSPNFLAFRKTKDLWFKNSITFILYLFHFRSIKLLHGISTEWPKKLLMFDQA